LTFNVTSLSTRLPKWNTFGRYALKKAIMAADHIEGELAFILRARFSSVSPPRGANARSGYFNLFCGF